MSADKAKKLIKSIIRRADTMFTSDPTNDINRRAISEEAKEALTELQNEEARIKELEVKNEKLKSLLSKALGSVRFYNYKLLEDIEQALKGDNTNLQDEADTQARG